MSDLNALDAISPLDGRYARELDPLRPFFGEGALIQRRLRVEIRYLQALLPKLGQTLPDGLKEHLAQLEADTTLIQTVKQHEQTTRHDVKAVEYALADALREDYPEAINWLHWGLTSEDVNNLAYALMLSESSHQVMLPTLYKLLERLADWIQGCRDVAMLARTHGQPASPTTLGKEYAVFAARLLPEIETLKSLLPVSGKLNGATGNWHLFNSFFPEHNWPDFSEQFIQSLGLKHAAISTQIVTRESYARVLHSLLRLNEVLIDLCRDTWHYVSIGYLILKRRSIGEVGSSTMPHKINPVMFENAEGNLELANAILGALASKLLKSRLQRDLSDSTALRNLGVAFGHSLLAWQNLMRGLAQLAPDPKQLNQDLDSHWEVLAEPLQHALRLQGREVPYDLIRQHTQGLRLDGQSWQNLLQELNCELAIYSPHTYTGLASQLTDQVHSQLKAFLHAHKPDQSET